MDFAARSYGFGDADPTVIIGEAGVNHNGDPKIAFQLVDAAVAAGVHIVKFQIFRTENAISRFAGMAPYQQQTSPNAATQFDLCKPLELPEWVVYDLKRYCDKSGIGFLCSAFDNDSVDLLVDGLKVTSLKVASGEVTNLPFLRYIGSRKVGVILSTGACTVSEVATAVAALRQSGCPDLVLLHCVSSYPAPANELNLRAMHTLKENFKLPVGFSDHSIGVEAPVVAAALGAVAIEKHFTLDRTMEGPDHKASLEPHELKMMVDAVRFANHALGDGIKKPMPCELPNLPLIRRSLVARGNLRKGDRLSRETIQIKRPANGIEPCDLDKVIDRQLSRDIQDDEPLTWASLI